MEGILKKEMENHKNNPDNPILPILSRRKFLKDLGKVTAALALSGPISKILISCDSDHKSELLKNKEIAIVKNIAGIKYEIQKGDTLWGIVRKFSGEAFGEFVEYLAQINNVSDENSIRYGENLFIPLNLLTISKTEEILNDNYKIHSIDKQTYYEIPIINNIWHSLDTYGFDPSNYKKVFDDNKHYNPAFKHISSDKTIPGNTNIYVNKKYLTEADKSAIAIKKPEKINKISKTGEYIEPEKIPGVNKSFYEFENNIEIVSSELKDLTIVLDPGHGGGSERPFINNIQEHEVVYDITNRLFVLLKQHGADVYTTIVSPKGPHIHRKQTLRPDKNEVYYGTKKQVGSSIPRDLSERREIANQAFRDSNRNDKLFLSIHTNASGNKKAHGLEVFVNKGEKNSESFANKIRHVAEKNLKIKVRDLKFEPKGIIRNDATKINGKGRKTREKNPIKCLAKILAELGFHSNKADAKKFADPNWRQKYAEMLFNAIVSQHFEKNPRDTNKENSEDSHKLSLEDFLNKTKTLTEQEKKRAITLDNTYKANRKKEKPLSKSAMGEMFVYYSKAVEEHYGVPTEVALIQTVLESAWGLGTKERKLPRSHLNFHGIKDANGKPYKSNEGKNANVVKVSKFGYYNSVWESFSSYGARLKYKKWKNAKTTVYAKAFKAKTPREFIKKLAPIYAGDKNYANKCIATWETIKRKWPKLTTGMSLDRKL